MNLAGLLDRYLRVKVTTEPLSIRSMPDALDIFRREVFTGRVCVHFHEGHPTALELPDPQRIKILKG